MLGLYKDIVAFVRRHEDLTPATALAAGSCVTRDKSCIELELAVTIGARLPFVQTTYKLKGDVSGPAIL